MQRLVLSAAAAFVTIALASSAVAGAPKSLKVDARPYDMAASRDGRWLAVAPSERAPVLFFVGEPPEPAEGEEAPAPPPQKRELACPPATINSLAFTPDSRYLVIEPDLEDDEMIVRVFSTETAEQVLEIDCRATKREPNSGRAHAMAGEHVWAVRPGPAGAQFYLARNDGLEIWDADEKKQVAKDDDFDPIGCSISLDGALLVCESGGRLIMRDPASGEELRRIEEEALAGQLKKPKKKNQQNFSPGMSLGGISTDGKIAVVAASQKRVMDRNKLKNTSAKPKDRLAAMKDFGWVEAFDTSTGESLWVHRTKERVYRSSVSVSGSIVAVEDKGKLQLLDIETGKSKGKLTASGDITAMASADGTMWWYASEKGVIKRK